MKNLANLNFITRFYNLEKEVKEIERLSQKSMSDRKTIKKIEEILAPDIEKSKPKSTRSTSQLIISSPANH